MKVLILNHNQERFGTYFRCFYLSKNLAGLGVTVTMVCASGKPLDLLVRSKKVTDNFTLITLPRIKYHKYFTGQILRLFLTIPIVLFADYDVLHAFTAAQPQIGIPALLAKWIRKKPVVVDWDDLWGGGFAEEHGGFVARVLSFFEEFVPKHADLLTHVSDYLWQRMAAVRSDMKHIKIPNGANIDEIHMIAKEDARRRLGIASAGKIIVSVGNTYFPGGLSVLFRAMKKIQKSQTNAHLYMVGYTDVPDKLAALQAEIAESVTLTGSVSFSAVLLYLSAADILVLPMEDNPIERARFPVRLGDYLSSGKPIVSNASGEVATILTRYRCGMVTPPRDASGFADKLLYVLHHPKAAVAYGKHARFVAREVLAWNTLAGTLARAYDEVVHG